MTLLRVLVLIGVMAGAAGAVAACVSEAPITPDGGGDTGSTSDGSMTSDAGVDTGPACPPPDNTGGVMCIDKRCQYIGQFCCVGLGGNQFNGTCVNNSQLTDSGPAGYCDMNSTLYVQCLKASDCSSGGDKCCLPMNGLFQVVDAAVCPIALAFSDASAPSPPQCNSQCTNSFQLCATDSECAPMKKCKPAKLLNMGVGVCL